MKKVLFALICLLNLNSYSQSDNIDAIIPPQGFGIQLLNSSGNSSIVNDVSNLGNMNPASISNFKNRTIGFSYQFNSNIDHGWINNSTVNRKNDFIPQSAGGVLKWNELTLGIGYSQNYNLKVDFDCNTSGIGEPSITEFQGRVYSYSFALAYSLKNILKGNSSVDVGLNYSINKVNFSQKNVSGEIVLSDNADNFSFGIQYSNKNDSVRGTIIALSYTTVANFEAAYNDQSGFTIVIRHINSPNSVIAEKSINGNIPDRFNLDLSTDLSSNFNLIGSFSQVFWKKSDNNLKDQFEFSIGAVYKINQMISPAFNIYYTDKNYEKDIFNLNEKFNALFLIAGLKFNYEMFYADLAIADSHLFSGDFRKQTIGKLAVGVHL